MSIWTGGAAADPRFRGTAPPRLGGVARGSARDKVPCANAHPSNAVPSSWLLRSSSPFLFPCAFAAAADDAVAAVGNLVDAPAVARVPISRGFAPPK